MAEMNRRPGCRERSHVDIGSAGLGESANGVGRSAVVAGRPAPGGRRFTSASVDALIRGFSGGSPIRRWRRSSKTAFEHAGHDGLAGQI